MQLITILFAGAVFSQNVTEVVNEVQECLKKNNCDGNVDCASKCVKVPNPTYDQAEKNNKCYADCIPEKASAEDTDKITSCQAKCLVSFQEHATVSSSPSLNSSKSESNAAKPSSNTNNNVSSSAISYSVISSIASVFVTGVAFYLL